MASLFRPNVMRRGEQSPNPGEPRQPEAAEEQGRQERSRGSFPFSRRFVPTLFTGRVTNAEGRHGERRARADSDDSSSSSSSAGGSSSSNEEEPKTPLLPEQQGASTRLHLPHITRPAWARGSSRPPPPPSPPSSSRRSSASVDTAQYPGLATPRAVAVLRSESGTSQNRSRSSSESGPAGRRRFDGPDPAELHLAALADSGRRRRERHQHGYQHGHRHGHGHGHRDGHRDGHGRGHRGERAQGGSAHGPSSASSSSRRMRRFEGDEFRTNSGSSGSRRDTDADVDGESPRRFLFCFPWVKSRRLRGQILKCFVSGLLMVAMLSVYLALSMTQHIGSSTFTIMLILMILFATVIFCHGLVRICMLLMGHHRPESRNGGDAELRGGGGGGGYPHHRDMAEVLGPGGYAVPRRPIRVVLARDEEAAGLGGAAGAGAGAGKLEPPAYGVWRESVRIDPNRFFWQRNEAAPSSPGSSDSGSESGSRSRSGSGPGSGPGSDSRPGTARRPPSYSSEDGVEYVIEARPRSIAPPPHSTASDAAVSGPGSGLAGSGSYYGSTGGGGGGGGSNGSSSSLGVSSSSGPGYGSGYGR